MADTERSPESDEEPRWRSAVAELEALDQVMDELREELQQFEVRRKVLAAREKQLRPVRPKEAEKEAPQEAANPATDVEAADRPGRRGSEPVMFSIEDPEVVDEPSADEAGEETLQTKQKLVPADKGDDWEQGLDSFGVAKCGVCGMKLPLDPVAIEAHCLECENNSKEGRSSSATGGGAAIRPTTASLQATAIQTRDRAASLKAKLSEAAGAQQPWQSISGSQN